MHHSGEATKYSGFERKKRQHRSDREVATTNVNFGAFLIILVKNVKCCLPLLSLSGAVTEGWNVPHAHMLFYLDL